MLGCCCHIVVNIVASGQVTLLVFFGLKNSLAIENRSGCLGSGFLGRWVSDPDCRQLWDESLAGDMGCKGGASEEAGIGQMGGAVGTVVSLGPLSLGRAQALRSSWGHLGGVVPVPDPVLGWGWMDVVCGWVLWKAQEHPQGCSPCQALIRGAVTSPLFVQAPVISCTSWRLQHSSRTLQAQGQGCVCLVCTILHTHKRQGLTNNTEKKREAGRVWEGLWSQPTRSPAHC